MVGGVTSRYTLPVIRFHDIPHHKALINDTCNRAS